EDRAVTAGDHRAGSAHRRVEESEPSSGRRRRELPCERRRNRAHLDEDHRSGDRVEQASRPAHDRVDGVERRQDGEHGVCAARRRSWIRGAREATGTKGVERLRPRVVAGHGESASEQALRDRGSEQPDADEGDLLDPYPSVHDRRYRANNRIERSSAFRDWITPATSRTRPGAREVSRPGLYYTIRVRHRRGRRERGAYATATRTLRLFSDLGAPTAETAEERQDRGG